MQNILEISDLTKKYQDFSLEKVSFNLEKGWVMGFIGPNGAGKTTTIKLIMNLIRRDGGTIRLLGMDNLQQEVQVKQKIGFVYEDIYFYEELTVGQMVKIIAPYYEEWDQAAFLKLIKEFALPQDQKIKTFSRGMRMKASLAVALAHNARLLIMDEPTSGLDPVFRNELLEILREYMNEERSILFSTHVTSDLDRIADAVTMINKGRIVFHISKEELQESYGLVKGEKRLLDENLKQHLIGVRESSFGFAALTNDLSAVRRKWGDGLLVERASLEDVMLYTVRGDK